MHVKLATRFSEVEMKLNDFLTIAPQVGPSETEDESSGDAIFTSSELKFVQSLLTFLLFKFLNAIGFAKCVSRYYIAA